METAAIVGDWIGISSRRVRELRADGVLPGDEGEGYDLKACVTAYCAHMRPSAGRAAGGGSGGASSVDNERARLMREQADGVAMKNAETRAKLLPIASVEAAVGPLLSSVRARVLAIPTTVGPLVVGIGSLPEAIHILTQAVHDALSAIASTQVVVDAASGRARQDAGDDAAVAGADEASAASDGEPVGRRKPVP